MTNSDHQLARALQHADANMPVEASCPALDAAQLLRQATSRGNTRLARRATVSMLVLAAVATLILRHDGGNVEPTALRRSVDIAELASSIEQLRIEAAALAASMDDAHEPSSDILSAIRNAEKPKAKTSAQLRSELNALESRIAAGGRSLDWDLEWSRSGALQLELARIEARTDRDGAASSYRRIATTYAGTRWGDEAQLALAEVAGP